jgi:hypothetical protein
MGSVVSVDAPNHTSLNRDVGCSVRRKICFGGEMTPILGEYGHAAVAEFIASNILGDIVEERLTTTEPEYE